MVETYPPEYEEYAKVLDELLGEGMPITEAITTAAARLGVPRGSVHRFYYKKGYRHHRSIDKPRTTVSPSLKNNTDNSQPLSTVSAPELSYEVKKKMEPNTELLLLRYFAIEAREKAQKTDVKWEKAEILYELTKHCAIKWIAEKIERTGNYVRILVRTYEVFPDKNNREETLSFWHHAWVARKKGVDPYHWIKVAAEENLSIRDLQTRINNVPRKNSTTVKQLQKEIQGLREENKALTEKNEVLIEENQRLKNIIGAIGEEVNRVA